jgi:hypothetical protein
MLKVVSAVVFLLLIVTETSAYAVGCDGQKGRVIFEDDFSDDSGGWAHGSGAGWSAGFGKSGLTLRMQDPITSVRFLNITFAAWEGNFCVEAIMPGSAEIIARSGLLFLANDNANFYALMVGGDVPGPLNDDRGAISLWRVDGGSWGLLGTWSEPKIKLDPGAVVVLRAEVKANLITASVNGVELKKVRIPGDGNNLKFGVYAETSNAAPAPGVSFQFKRYKVTAGE